MIKFLKTIGYWLLYFLGYTGLTLALGSILGAILYVLFGTTFTEYSVLILMKKGLWIGFRYAGVWAGGLAIVLCFVKGAKSNKMTYDR